MRRNTAMTILLLLLPTMAATAPAQEEDGFVPLVEGTDPGQFTLVQIDSDTISIGEDGEVALTGRPNGYFATRESYGDYILRFEWMYERPEGLEDDASFDGNSGLLVHIGGEHKVWPECIEVQLKHSDAGHIFGIGGGKFESRMTNDDRARAIAEALRPVGQWNRQEVACRGGAIECKINDVLIDSGEGAAPASGPIGWQSEGRPIRFRNLRIRPLD